MKSIFACSPLLVAAGPITLPAEMFSDVNKGPLPAVNVIAEGNADSTGKQIALSERIATEYAQKSSSFLSPGATRGATTSGGNAYGISSGNNAGDNASALKSALDRVNANGSAGTTAYTGGSSRSSGISQDMAASQGKIAQQLESAEEMYADARDIFDDASEKALVKEIRAAVKSSPAKATTLGNLRSAVFGSSRGASFLESGSAKISESQLQAIAADVAHEVDSNFAAPRANGQCASCNSVNYSACPTGFAADGSVCAPSTYTGFCNRAFLNSGSDLEKQEFEVLCQTCFPCA